MKNKIIIILLIITIVGIISINGVSSASNTNDANVTLKSTPIKINENNEGFTDGKSPGIYITDDGDNKNVQTIAYKKVKSIKVTTTSGKTKIFKEGIDFNNTQCKNGYFLNLTLIPSTWGAEGSPRIYILYGDWIANVTADFEDVKTPIVNSSVTENNSEQKPSNEINVKKKSNSNDSTIPVNPSASASMKETGTPIMAVLLILMATFGILVRKK